MVKRVREELDHPAPVEVKKAKKLSQSEQRKPSSSDEPVQNDTQIDISSPIAVMESLLKPFGVKKFFDEHWEKKPIHIKRDDSGYYGSAFTRSTFLEILSNNELLFEVDVNACRYVDGEKEMLNEDGSITAEQAKDLTDKKNATLQFHQPQRFTDILWCVLEKMETYFGNLVGSNVYMTPPGTQGLAPHCDDVEAFILQLEGTKHWKIYEPLVKLSRDYTQDLAQESLGEPILDVQLQTGDLLYLPRGYIHQAPNDSGTKNSTHITISTYQSNTIGDFMTHAVAQAIENGLDDPTDVSFREGLPINYLSYLGTSHDLHKYIELDKPEESVNDNGVATVTNGDAKASSSFPSNTYDERMLVFKERVKDQLMKLVDHLDLNTAADAMNDDFFASRLPPYKCTAAADDDDDDTVKETSLSDEIRLCFKDHACIAINDEANEDDEDESQCDEDDDGSDDEEDDEEDEDNVEMEEKKSEENSSNVPADQKKEDKKRTPSNVSSASKGSTVSDDVRYELNTEEGELLIKHSLLNERVSHMSSGHGKPHVVKLPVTYAVAVKHLFTVDGYTRVSELPGLSDDEEKIHLATRMLADGLLELK